MLESKASGGFSLTVCQARLDVSVSAIGSMNPQIQINYSGIIVKTKVANGLDRLPVWCETFNFEFLEHEVEIVALHKPLILKDVEIGRCKISIEENSGWFELRKEGRKVGSVRINIREDKETLMSTNHTSKSSWDLRDDYIKKLNELELEREEATFYKKKYKLKLEKIRQKNRKSTCHEEITDANNLSQDNQELVYKIQAQIKKLQNAQEDLKKRKELLRIQEENIVNEKSKIAQEWEEIEKTRQELMVLKKKINEDYQKIRNEQDKLNEDIRSAEELRQKNSKSSREQQRYNQIINRMQNISSPDANWKQENVLDRRSQSIEDLHEKAEVNRVPMTVEKPRPPLHPLSANSSRLISFE